MRKKKRGQWTMTLPRFDIVCSKCGEVNHVPNLHYVGSIKFPRVPKEVKGRYKNKGETPIDRERSALLHADEAEKEVPKP